MLDTSLYDTATVAEETFSLSQAVIKALTQRCRSLGGKENPEACRPLAELIKRVSGHTVLDQALIQHRRNLRIHPEAQKAVHIATVDMLHCLREVLTSEYLDTHVADLRKAVEHQLKKFGELPFQARPSQDMAVTTANTPSHRGMFLKPRRFSLS